MSTGLEVLMVAFASRVDEVGVKAAELVGSGSALFIEV
jgi:hypothetical protein